MEIPLFYQNAHSIIIKRRRMIESMKQFFFFQDNAVKRTCLVRMFLGIILFVLLTFGPYSGFYVDTASLLYKPNTYWSSLIPPLGESYLILRSAAQISAICVVFGIFCPFSLAVLALSFGVISCYVSCFSTDYWITNSHLFFFLMALLFCPAAYKYSNTLSEWKQTKASMALAFMIAYVAVIYLQSGISKLLHGGPEWFLSGQTLYVHTVLTGTPIGRYLAEYPWLFQVMTIGTALFEFGIFPFFSRKPMPSGQL